MTYDLRTFGLHDMIDMGRKVRHRDEGHHSMEEAAASVVDLFYDHFRTGDTPNCVLARCFKTHTLSELTSPLQQQACLLLEGHPPKPNMQCLTLLATRGEHPKWNDRFSSASHQVIPLPTVQRVKQAPMLSQLVLQLGLEIEHLVDPFPEAMRPSSFDVFHVECALGSDVVPDQEHFVRPFGVKSVLGFGGLLPAGELFAIILFTRVTVSPQTASLFGTLALGVKLKLLPFSGKRVFAER